MEDDCLQPRWLAWPWGMGLILLGSPDIIHLMMKITPVQQKKKMILPVAAAVVGSVVVSACQQQQLPGEPPMQALGGVIMIDPAKGAPQAKPAK